MIPQFSLPRAEALDFSMDFDSGYDLHHSLPFKTLNLSRFFSDCFTSLNPRDLTSSNPWYDLCDKLSLTYILQVALRKPVRLYPILLESSISLLGS